MHEEAPFIGIVVALFYKEIGNAFLRLDNKELAISNFQKARIEFINYRNSHVLSKPSDWLKDIEIIEKRLEKLSSNRNRLTKSLEQTP